METESIKAVINEDHSEKVAAFNRLTAAELKKDEAMEDSDDYFRGGREAVRSCT